MRALLVAVAGLALTAAPAGAAGAPHVKRVHIRVDAGGHTRTAVRVCGGARGRSSVSFVEAKTLGGKHAPVDASHVRVRHFKQDAHCVTAHFRWKLLGKFVGVGRYKVTAAVFDSADMKSNSKSDSLLTTD